MKIEKTIERKPVIVGSARAKTKGDIVGTEKELVFGVYIP